MLRWSLQGWLLAAAVVNHAAVGRQDDDEPRRGAAAVSGADDARRRRDPVVDGETVSPSFAARAAEKDVDDDDFTKEAVAEEADDGRGGGQPAEAEKEDLQGRLQYTGIAEDVQEEEEATSGGDLTISFMLFGFIIMIMALFWVVNDPDEDMQFYSWSVISSTISIFVGVLMFVSLNAVIHEVFLKDRKRWIHVLADMGQMVFYLIAMQILVLRCSGVLEDEPFIAGLTRLVGDEEVKVTIREQRDQKLSKMKCWALLTGHMSGFASINFGGSMQHGKIFQEYPICTFWVVPAMYAFHSAFGWVALVARRRLIHHGGFKPTHVSHRYSTVPTVEAERIHLADGKRILRTRYEEQVLECMTEVASLTVSFLSVQAARVNISGVMPNNMGLELTRYRHDEACSMNILFVIGMLLLFIVLLVNLGKRLPRGMCRRIVIHGQTSTAMAVAWSLLCVIKWELTRNVSSFGNPNTIKARVVTAAGTSTAAFAAIYALDKLADADCTGESTDEALYNMISAIGILVGFSWEQAFEGAAVGVACEVSPRHTVYTKLGIAVIVGLVCISPWRRYILQIVIRLEDRRREIKDNALMHELEEEIEEQEDDDEEEEVDVDEDGFAQSLTDRGGTEPEEAFSAPSRGSGATRDLAPLAAPAGPRAPPAERAEPSGLDALVAAMNERRIALERRASIEVSEEVSRWPRPAWRWGEVFSNMFGLKEDACCEVESPRGSRQRVHVEVFESGIGYQQVTSAREVTSNPTAQPHHVKFRSTLLRD